MTGPCLCMQDTLKSPGENANMKKGHPIWNCYNHILLCHWLCRVWQRRPRQPHQRVMLSGLALTALSDMFCKGADFTLRACGGMTFTVQ